MMTWFTADEPIALYVTSNISFPGWGYENVITAIIIVLAYGVTE